MSHLWKKVQDEMVDEKTLTKKEEKNIVLVPSQRYQDSRHLLQNPKVPRNVMGFSNRAQRFTGPNYLDVDSPLQQDLYLSMYGFSLIQHSAVVPDLQFRHSWSRPRVKITPPFGRVTVTKNIV